MREEAVKELLNKTGNNWSLVTKLIDEGKLKETEYAGKRFYMRVLTRDIG